jgi:hypothetical protein
VDKTTRKENFIYKLKRRKNCVINRKMRTEIMIMTFLRPPKYRDWENLKSEIF